MATKRFKYSEDDMRAALLAVENGMSVYSAAKAYKVPRMTLSDKVKGKTPISRKMGPPSILSSEEEMFLERWILHLASIRFPIRKEQLLDSVQLLSKQLKKQDKFSNGRPGRHWYEAFLKRHPLIAERSAQNLTARRAAVSEANLRNWFAEVRTYMDENNLLNVFNDPRRIFNCDETAFFLSPKDNRVLAKRGQKTVHTVINSGEKECITTLLMGNAAGDIAPLMIVINLKRIPQKLSLSAPKSWAIGRSENGWMAGETFFEYFANVFHPWLVRNKVEFPVIVFCDGHSSHLTMALSDFCRDNLIELVALYPNATQILQPMDVAVFHPLKESWKKAVYSFRIRNAGLPLKRDNFCPILVEALKSITPDILKNGFRRCGLCPIDADALDYTQLPGDQNLKNATRPYDPKILEHLTFLEQNISPEKVAQFKTSGEAWTGALEDSSLFDFWKKLKNKTKQDDKPTENANILPVSNNNENRFSINPDVTTDSQEDFLMHSEYDLEGNVEWLENVFNDKNGSIVYEVTNTGELVRISTEENNGIRDQGGPRPEINKKVEEHEKMSNNDNSLKTSHENAVSGMFMNEKTDSNIVGNTECEIQDNGNDVATNSEKSVPSILECSTEIVAEEQEKTQEQEKASEQEKAQEQEKASEQEKAQEQEKAPPEQEKAEVTCRTPPAGAMTMEPTIIEQFPSPFKNSLFWPSTSATGSKCQKRKSKEKVPAVATSGEWRQYFSKKEKDKADKIKKTQENKRKREEIAEKKKEAGKTAKGKKKKCKEKESAASDSVSNNWYCKICEDEFEQDMIQCLSCKCWVHEVCANISKSAKKFVCPLCN